jgi:hypothetical protein
MRAALSSAFRAVTRSAVLLTTEVSPSDTNRPTIILFVYLS